MRYNIETTPHFEKELKDLAKRYKSMKQDFGKFKDSLKEDPFQGVDLGGGLRKIRMTIDSKRKGKSWRSPSRSSYHAHQAVPRGSRDGESVNMR